MPCFLPTNILQFMHKHVLKALLTFHLCCSCGYLLHAFFRSITVRYTFIQPHTEQDATTLPKLWTPQRKTKRQNPDSMRVPPMTLMLQECPKIHQVGQVHFHPNSKKEVIQKHFDPKTLSSKNTFIQKHFHPKTFSSKTILSKKEDNIIHDTFIHKNGFIQ